MRRARLQLSLGKPLGAAAPQQGRENIGKATLRFAATLPKCNGSSTSTLNLTTEPSMRLGILSDTHGHVPNTLAAVRMLESLDVQELLHCGDLCSAEIPRLLAQWPAHYVFGNCDVDMDAMRGAIAAAGGFCHDWFGDLTLGGRRIGLIHSHDARRFSQVKSSGQYDLVCYGHTHEAEFHHEGRTLVLNPGALYRANPHTIAVLDLETMQPLIVPV